MTMTEHAVTIETGSGRCGASLFVPASTPAPAVVVFMDGVGIRPAMLEVGKRLAAAGYVALVPDLFHRTGPYTAPDPKKLFADPDQRAAWFAKHVTPMTAEHVRSDTSAFLDFLGARSEVKSGPIGATGYCMGGGLALSAAGNFPDRIGAAASFHGSRLATDAKESPHRLAPRIKARVYVAGATEDASFPDDMKARLEDALTTAGVEHTVETYPARHGWVIGDMPVYDETQAERAYRALFDLLQRTL